MNENKRYTLVQLAEETGLTERTVRYYIEQVLPPQHKQGRGKLARYGQDTLNSIRFIVLVGERYGFKPGQAKGVLARVPQETIDRVVRGEEELAVMTVPMETAAMKPSSTRGLSRSSERMSNYKASKQRSLKTARPLKDRMEILPDAEMSSMEPGPEYYEPVAYSIAEPAEPWRTIFTDQQVRIQCRGERRLTPHQQEQIETAAHLIKLALK